MPDFLSEYKPTEGEAINFDDDTDDEADAQNEENADSGGWGGMPTTANEDEAPATFGWE